ncbi:ATP-binding cassette domain-containing protein [Candidatus Uabimicrobium amorphum]|uniref:ATP-binding protein Uup n=1 Tax=Uabimicrobium amorphum TaxID=2596890 RepID=A0A5S9ILN2_UABAM|nr:ATP-binding cassette domain-containing protein [Candidatus Uabimicrobium amorphum]BBM82855.1 heme ABC transporter ATPase [Candidatus Uabimicrobium amorphum]
MIYINMQDVTLGFGGHPILENAHLQIHDNEKVAVIGRNGQGKSTLLKLLCGEITPEAGEIQKNQGLKIAYLGQEVPQDMSGVVFDILVQGLGDLGEAIVEYNAVSQKLAEESSDALLQKLEDAQKKLDDNGGWEQIQNVEEIISHLQLDSSEKFENLSAGKKRRVLLGKALVKKPDLLLLDEPTNHLDIPSISWLEEFFGRYSSSILFVTHDRRFLQKIATRIVELSAGALTSWDCDYETFLTRREDLLRAQEKEQQLFDKRLAEEEVWIRKGILARRTRNQGRVRRLKEMRDLYRERRKKMGNVKMGAQHAEKSGNLVVRAQNISFSYGNVPIINDLSLTIMRGDKVGIIGENGTGKTTLLKILLGELQAQKGDVHLGTNLQIAYFDQLRNLLDREKSVYENIGEGNDHVVINGRKKHVMGYLQDFLFSTKDANNPVWTLSGGEQNRLLLAKLFLRPSNVLVLDEPTNDLDIETLDLLEQLIIDYPGTVFLVSHDRVFLNNVVTNSIVFENDEINEYAGGYDDWLMQRPEVVKEKKQVTYSKPQREKKLSHKEKRELEQLPLKIEELEERQQKLYAESSDPQFYQKDKEEIATVQKELQEIGEELEKCYARWEELEELA